STGAGTTGAVGASPSCARRSATGHKPTATAAARYTRFMTSLRAQRDSTHRGFGVARAESAGEMSSDGLTFRAPPAQPAQVTALGVALSGGLLSERAGGRTQSDEIEFHAGAISLDRRRSRR